MTNQATSPVKNERMLLMVLAGMLFTHLLDFMVMAPLGPQLIRLLHIDTQQFAWLMSSYTFAAALSGLLSTTYIDRFDRRKLILVTFALFTLATLLCGLAQGFSSFLIARALAGAFGGMISAMAYTMVADLIPFERRAAASGVMMSSFSAATVAGVPLTLFLADSIPALGWRAPFFFIVTLNIIFGFLGYIWLPSVTAHLGHPKTGNILQQILVVAKEPNHITAFAFMSFLTLGGFTVLPYVALYLTSNVGMSESFITTIYLCGGAATLITARWIGVLADRHGKLRVFRWLAVASFAPILVTTQMGPTAWWMVLLSQTVFFILVSGRIVPGIAMISSASMPQVRGTVMTLAASAQMLAIGLASMLTGIIISRNAAGHIVHFDLVGYFAIVCGLISIWLANRLKVALTPETPADCQAP